MSITSESIEVTKSVAFFHSWIPK